MSTRIAFVVSYYKPAFVYGGPVHSISLLCESLARFGTTVTVFTTNANGKHRLDVPLNQPINVNGVEVWYFPLAQNGFFFYSPALGAACHDRLHEFDLVVLECVLGYALFPAAKACIRSKVPYIIPLRGQLLPWSMRQGYWKKMVYLRLLASHYLNHAAALHCTDPDEAQFIPSFLTPPTFVVPNGVDPEKFDCLPARNILRTKLGIPEDAKVMLFLGRLHVKKRPDIAVSTLGACQTMSHEVHLVLAGPDQAGMTPQLRRQAELMGCANRLHIVGLLKGMAILEALVDADLFLMPSEPESENFGMSALEALAAGVPILVSTGVPMGRWAEAADAGKVVTCDIQVFQHTAIELLSQPARLQKMAQNGMQLARGKFDIAIVAQQMLAQYQAIITSGRPLPSV